MLYPLLQIPSYETTKQQLEYHSSDLLVVGEVLMLEMRIGERGCLGEGVSKVKLDKKTTKPEKKKKRTQQQIFPRQPNNHS
jgi:hypothetical protein